MENCNKFLKDFLKLKPTRLDSDMRKGFLLLYKGYSIYVNLDFNIDTNKKHHYFYVVGNTDDIFYISEETFEMIRVYYWNVDINNFQKIVNNDLRKLKLDELENS